jgi:pseudaminic acid biosynthesis-associated methylase
MSRTTEQMFEWMGIFGQEYTDRNSFALTELEALYQRNYGITRTELNRKFLDAVDRSARILEVGSNVGNQLICLQSLGFFDLYGIELQSHAVEVSKSRTKGINILKGSVFDIPFKDAYFDMVFTSGVLIHIHPNDLAAAMSEIHRCTREYIWGFEYYADEMVEVIYRENTNLLWKADYAKLYLELFEDLSLVKEERLKYIDNGNIDSMFLLKK